VARLASALALALMLVALGACSVTASTASTTPVATGSATAPAIQTAAPATATPTSGPAPHAQVIGEFSNIVAIGSNTTGSASASCPNGMPLLGGGFIARLANANGEDGVAPDDSYPSSSTTWKVDVTTLAGGVNLTAIAVCLQANFAATTTIVQNSNGGGDTTVACPSGAALTGGGFRSGGGTNTASQPNGNGWRIATGVPFGGSASPTVYALCATQGLHAAATQSATKTVANATVTSNGSGCPSGQYPVGGGYNGYPNSSDQFWRVFLNGPDTGQGTISSGWMAEVHSGELSPSAFTVYSVCATH
jgi:hypothetical protein